MEIYTCEEFNCAYKHNENVCTEDCKTCAHSVGCCEDCTKYSDCEKASEVDGRY